MNAKYKSVMKGPVPGPFVLPILRYKAFFSILQEKVVEKGKKVVSRLPIADKKMFFFNAQR